MMDQRLQRQLDRVASRMRRLRLWTALAGAWLLAALAGAAMFGLNRRLGWYSENSVPALSIVALLLAGFFGWRAWRSVRDYRPVARQVESKYPELRWSLLAAVEQHPELPSGRYGYLQSRVIAEALHHGYRHPWQQVVPVWRLMTAQAANLTALVGFVAVLLVLSVDEGPSSATVGPSSLTAVGVVDRPLQVTVEPGDADVERGTSLLVTARFDGPLPADAVLVYETADGQVDRLPMSKSLDDPVFGGRIASVDEPLTYRVRFAEQISDTYRVTVFDYPNLVRADGELTFPEYTQLESRLVQDVRHLSVVEGTELALTCHLNKQVDEARLVADDDFAVTLQADPSDRSIYRTKLKLDQSRRFQVKLLDQQGRVNPRTTELVITVLPNRPPDLKLVLPSRDVQVSPLEELELQASAWDDYGLSRVGLSYSVGGDAPHDLVLGQSIPGKERVEIRHVVAFEELASEPDQLLSYHFWTEDAGPDGQLRRVSSDMFFAEVRPFEEIFRQGQSPPGGDAQPQQQQQQQQGGNAQAAQQLAEKQKEIINATWKLIRRETANKLSGKFEEDVQLLVHSQAAAMEEADSMGERIQDSESQQHLLDVKQKMLEAVQDLMRAHQPPSPEPLPQALASEQAAYQALLKLRAREHRVVRNNQRQQQQGSSSRSSGRSQQQLQQLQLNEDENRYETQRNAPSQQNQETQADRETRQVLNRLRELARRQNDLNKRLKELQSALQEADTEQEREEIRRRLKRLRDQQQQMLRDTDELQARMDQPQNQERMSDSRQQLQQTRDNVRQASEALEQGQVSRAAAAGTRAERQLNQLRDEFRRQASGQFDQQMQQMREDAQQLSQKQQDLADRMTAQDGRRRPNRAPDAQDRSADPFDPEPQPPADVADRPEDQRAANASETSARRRERSPDSPQPPPRQAKSLRDSGERERLEEELQQQKERLEQLIDRMQQTVLDAEQAEPLLAEQLYDTVRSAQQKQLDRVLDATSRSLRRGLMDDAIQQEDVARRGIDQLNDGVQRAAESVLGDDTDALRRARDELNRLARELEEEVQRNRPDARLADSSGRRGPGQNENQDRGNDPPGEGQEEPGPADDEASGRARNAPSQSDRDQTGREPGEASRDQAPPNQRNEPSSESSQRGSGDGPGPTRPNARDGSPRRAQAGLRRQLSESGRSSPGGTGSQGGAPDRSGGGPGGFEPFLDDRPATSAPIAGEDFLSWSDRLRDVEEMVDDPQLRSEAARIRDRAKGIRLELKRHSKPPNWELVQLEVFTPLVQLRDRVAEELLKRTSPDALVPIDRDPVPPKYADDVRRYYERLGSGQ